MFLVASGEMSKVAHNHMVRLQGLEAVLCSTPIDAQLLFRGENFL